MQLLSTPNEISFRLCRGGDVFCLVRVIRGGAGWGGTAESLTTAEKAFARESVEKGMRTAFLDALSDDGMVFEGALSRNGDLGFLWGEYRVGPAAATGDYLRAWRKDGQGGWKLMLDLLHPR
jgi:hypothetical protein